MKYAVEPKPVEYEPLTQDLLRSLKGQELGPFSFNISLASHTKTLELLNQNTNTPDVNYPFLLPSEVWGCARVLSNYFGRLNEVAISKTKWEIYSLPGPKATLLSRSRIVDVYARKGLPYATIETATSEKNGREEKPVMKQIDEFILFHDIPEDWRYADKNIKNFESLEFKVNRRVYFRHNWDPKLWVNNIHNDWAKKWGYKSGLPEFIMYMDWIFDAHYRNKGHAAFPLIIEVSMMLPIYDGEEFEVVLSEDRVVFLQGRNERLRGVIY